MKTQEQQTIEWKQSWRDEYLGWICGFANADGGKLYIGKNDKGEVIKPANPDIANTFFRAGYIEAWGRGINKIVEECENANLPRPVFNFNFDGLRIEFKMNTPKPVIQKNNIPTSLETSSGGLKFIFNSTALLDHLIQISGNSIKDPNIDDIEKIKNLEPKSLKMIVFLFENTVLKRKELLQLVGVTNHSKNSKRFIEPLLNLNIINYTIKDKPNSALQKYILTAFGRKIAKLLKEGLENANETINNQAVTKQ